MTDNVPKTASGLIVYQTEGGRTRIECRFEGATLWFTQALIAELFQKDVRTINEHLVNIFDEGDMTKYDPGWLDALCFSGEIAWGRLSRRAGTSETGRRKSDLTRAAPIGIVCCDEVPWLLESLDAEEVRASLSHLALAVHDHLTYEDGVPTAAERAAPRRERPPVGQRI